MVHPDGLVLCYYGDDFTGSTDVMESLSFAGVKSVLFMAPPTAEQIAQFDGVRAVGVAGRTRSMSAQEMVRELVPVFTAFRELDTPIVHYKTSSTFDSSPEVGSIGQAIDLGLSVFGGPFVPLVVGAPVLKRYCVFGNLFARSGLDSDVFRLDRHPTKRAATTGGDTSYYVAKSLGVEALEAIAPMAPGSPLCRVYGQGLDGVEMTFKGGQVGTVDFF